MPCNVYPDDNYRVEYRDNPKTEAILCAAFKYIEKFASVHSFLRNTDWKEQGVTEADASSWWVNHQKKDTARKAREKNAELLRKKQQEAMKKLTAEERKILGL